MKKLTNTFRNKVNHSLFNSQIRTLKSELPSACTFLSLVTKSTGELCLRAMIKNAEGRKDSYIYSVPQDLLMTTADLDRIKNLITQKCNNYVS